MQELDGQAKLKITSMVLQQKPVHMASTSVPEQTELAMRWCDGEISEIVETVVPTDGLSAEEKQHAQGRATLPVRLGGLGLRRLEDEALGLWVSAAMRSVADIVEEFGEDSPKAVEIAEQAEKLREVLKKDDKEALGKLVHAEDGLEGEELVRAVCRVAKGNKEDYGPRGKACRKVSAARAKARFGRLFASSSKDQQISIMSALAHGASEWFTSNYCHLDQFAFAVRGLMHLGVLAVGEWTDEELEHGCNDKAECKKDKFHAMVCTGNQRERNSLHDNLADFMHRTLRGLGLRSVREPGGDASDASASRGDIKYQVPKLDARGKVTAEMEEQVGDVTVASSHSRAFNTSKYWCHLRVGLAARMASKKKVRKYQHSIRGIIPYAFEITGGQSEQVRRFKRTLGAVAEARKGVGQREFMARFSGGLSQILAEGVAAIVFANRARMGNVRSKLQKYRRQARE
jgi:hypothetical protein